MARDPYGESDVARKFNQKKPKPTGVGQDGDPKVAAAFMRKFGMGNLANFYEEQGGQAEKGQVPSMFGGMMDNKGNLTGVKPPGGFGNLGASLNVNALSSAEGRAEILKTIKPKNVATVGDAGGPTAQDFINAAPQAMFSIEPDRQPDDGPLPLANELELFASYSNVFAFGCLSPDEVNYPDDTYIKNGLSDGQIVFRSGTGLSAPRKPRTAAEMRYGIDTQYFINNVEIDTWIAPNKKSRQTNFHQIRFEVREPYSMGMLLQTMQLAALNAGYKNYLEAPWLLEMMFIGWKDIEKSNPSAPSTRKLLPLKVVSVEFNVDSEGSVYQFLCSAFNDEAFADNAQSISTDIQCSGRTLEEICQSGINSIATNLNTHKLKEHLTDEKGKPIALKDAGKIEVDEYIIAFPSKRASKDQAELYSSNKKGRDTATTGELEYKEFTDEETLEIVETGDVSLSTLFDQAGREYATKFARRKLIEGRLGYSIRRGTLSESIKKVITDKDMGINPIGLAKIAPEEPTGGGNADFGKATFTYDKRTENFTRGATSIDPTKRTIQFRSGTKIQRILEELVLISDWGKKLLLLEPNKEGMVPWFKIESQMYLIHDSKAEAKNGRMPRIYVYNVVPYDVHIGSFQKPNSPPPGYDKLVKQAVKAYNYMYTGLNKDILDFEIKLDNTFFSAINKMNGKESNDVANKATDKDVTEVSESQDGGEPGQDGGRKSQSEVANDSVPLSAGAIAETAEIQVARAFNEAIVRSEADLITLNMRILGDPYYIADSGMGNFNSAPTEYININANGSMDHQRGQVDVIINFKTPIDIDPEIGNYKMQAVPISGIDNFSGLYQVITVNNRIENNVFTQELSMVKRPNFDKKNIAESNTKKAVEINKEAEKELRQLEKLGVSKDDDMYKIKQLEVQNNLNNISLGQIGISMERATKLQAEIKDKLAADTSAREKINAQNKASDDRLIALAKGRATDPTGNPVATPPKAGDTSGTFADDAQASSSGSSAPTITTGYIDEKGLWVPYGID